MPSPDRLEFCQSILQTLWILKATARAVHEHTLGHGRAGGWVARG